MITAQRIRFGRSRSLSVFLRSSHLRFILLAAFPVLISVACGSQDFEAGSLGAVEVKPGDAIQIRSLEAMGAGLEVPREWTVGLAIEDYGPIKGRDVTMGDGIDSGCSEEGGRDAAQLVVNDPQVVGVIGTTCSVSAAVASPVISEAGLVMVSPLNAAPSLTSDLRGNAGSNYHPGYYRIANNDVHSGRAVAQFAYNELDLRNVATIDDGDPYTSGLAGSFAIAFKDLGGEVTSVSIKKGDTDMVPVLTQISDSNPDGVFFPIFPEEGTHLIRQLDQLPELSDVRLIGGSALTLSSFLALPESEGVYLEGPALNFGSNINNTTGKSGDELIAAYQTQYDEPPTSAYVAHAYDATTLLLRAIEEVAVEDGETLYIDRAELRKTLSEIADFNGIIGTMSCDEFGDCGTGNVDIAHHTDSSMTNPTQLPVIYTYKP
ncbi:MAG: branched-chain amino acid ABC transporter substrate-binding protein [Acidimicrobiaceae bacterium]|nr:branched-chain amino acid ABC transporter substrate-binding protein [Acidimicrobiaceae bacterium]